MEWLARCLAGMQLRPTSILDYGCGVGAAVPHFLDLLGVQRVKGVDVSTRSLDLARRRWGSARVDFEPLTARSGEELFDVVFANGVFHHIPVDQRSAAVAYVGQSLRPGGVFALWENNPFNPGTRLVMSRCAFDRDAVMIYPRGARRLLRDGGFGIVRTDFLFIFPAFLAALRPVEPLLANLPIGGQYQVLARRA